MSKEEEQVLSNKDGLIFSKIKTTKVLSKYG
jgi:hypothetical protein